MVVLTCSRGKSAKGRGILNILGNKRLYTWDKRTKIYFRTMKKRLEIQIGSTLKETKYISVCKIMIGVIRCTLTPHFGLSTPPK